MTVKLGFEKRSESPKWSAHATVERWSPEQVSIARVELGREPTALELKDRFAPDVTEVAGNLLTTLGLNHLTGRFISNTPQAVDNTHVRLGVGNDNTAASVGQTDLQAAAGSANRQYKTMDATYPTAVSGVLTFKSTFVSGDANMTWQEWALDLETSGGTASDGTTVNDVLINRKVASLGTKVSGAVWALTVSITIS